jgi:hypothetical protein
VDANGNPMWITQEVNLAIDRLNRIIAKAQKGQLGDSYDLHFIEYRYSVTFSKLAPAGPVQ